MTSREESESLREAGFSLLETVIAITILLLVLVPVSGLLATAFKVGANSRFEQAATEIAASTLDSQIQSGANTLLGEEGDKSLPSVTSGGQTYLLEQEVSPYDPGGTGCQSPSTNANVMLKVSVWATWADESSTATWWIAGSSATQGLIVHETSLVAVPATDVNTSLGSILVTIEGASSNGIENITTTATPVAPLTGSALTATSSQAGCTLFANVSPGSWKITFSCPTGYITEQDSATCLTETSNVFVTADFTATVPFDPTSVTAYDQAATVTGSYTVPMADGHQPNIPGNVNNMPLSFYNSTLTTDPYVTAASGSVFPFNSSPSYEVVAGSCGAESDPGDNSGASLYGTAVNLTPGGQTTAAFRLVPIQVYVNYAGTLESNASVTASVSNGVGNGADTNCLGPEVMPTLSLGNTTTVWTAYVKRKPRYPDAVLVATQGTSTSIGSSQNPSYGGQSVTFTAQVTHGFTTVTTGTVAFTADGASISGCSAESLASGTASCVTSSLSVSGTAHTIVANYGGTSTYNSSSATLNHGQTVQASPTSISISSAPTPLGYGVVNDTITAAVSATSALTPTGTVTFTVDGTTVCSALSVISGSATCTEPSILSGGSHTIVATYTSNSVNFSGTSQSASLSVTASTTTTALASSANPTTFNSPVTLTATVTSASGATPLGNVAFMDGSTMLATVAVSSGVAIAPPTSSLPIGTDSLTAVFTPTTSTNFVASTSVALAQVVNPPTGSPYVLCGLPYGVWKLTATYLTHTSTTEAPQIVVTITPAGISVDGGPVLAAGSSVSVSVQ